MQFFDTEVTVAGNPISLASGVREFHHVDGHPCG